MANWRILSFTMLCLMLSGDVHAEGDSYYFSTWQARPSSATTWASSSVMFDSSDQSAYSLSGPLYPRSPKFFHPGYGYATPAWPFRSPLRYYNQQYSFGMLTTGSPIDYTVRKTTMGSSGSVFGTAGLGQIGGLAPVANPHRPWYFPGSPGNDTEFQYGW